ATSSLGAACPPATAGEERSQTTPRDARERAVVAPTIAAGVVGLSGHGAWRAAGVAAEPASRRPAGAAARGSAGSARTGRAARAAGAPRAAAGGGGGQVARTGDGLARGVLALHDPAAAGAAPQLLVRILADGGNDRRAARRASAALRHVAARRR